MARSRKLWIGLSDRGTEGQWRFPTNNKIFDTNNANNVFQWHSGEPNNGWNNQDCVWVGYGSNGLMDDVNCGDRGLYGLCEIKVVNCDAEEEYYYEEENYGEV